ncbi:LysR substrate-binding domain-containing protein [Streptomyces griseofuscus]|uniref:LysR substrate-binding domain-containing protein n=1 Tax=Streptomyces griseofuscus TaxID=146922 RepID=UPI0037F88BB1
MHDGQFARAYAHPAVTRVGPIGTSGQDAALRVSRTLPRVPYGAMSTVLLPHRRAGAGHLSLADLREDSFALAGDGPLRQLAQRALLACDRAGFVPTVRAHADNLPGLLSYVASGLCVTLAPEHTAALSFPGVRFLPLTDEAPELTTTIAAPHRRHADPAVHSLSALAGASLAG